MPELPDVETFRRYLDAHALHKRIAGVHVAADRVLRDLSPGQLERHLEGREISSTRRHGKHLLAVLDDGTCLTLHFGMTGHLQVFADGEADPRHDRVRLDFEDGSHLAFVDQRMFGEVGWAGNADAFVAAEDLGPDAMSLDQVAFCKLLAGRRGRIKTALTDQTLLAGLGNIYSDEILFQAGIHPKTPVESLKAEDLATLYRTMHAVLRTCIDEGAGYGDLAGRLPAGYLLPHRKEGASCPRCGGTIRSLKMSGRTAYYCPTCQPEA